MNDQNIKQTYILTPNKIVFKPKLLKRDKECNIIQIKGIIQPKNILILGKYIYQTQLHLIA